MTDLAPHLTAFLQEHLPNERRFSRHTVQSYTECFRLLVVYAAEQIKVRPCALKIEHFTVALLLAFLESLEKVRNNSVGTRNIRLAAIKSFYRYVEYRVPSCLDHALQVRAIPQKRAVGEVADGGVGAEASDQLRVIQSEHDQSPMIRVMTSGW